MAAIVYCTGDEDKKKKCPTNPKPAMKDCLEFCLAYEQAREP